MQRSSLYEFARNQIVVASAGTGKTHALVGVIVHRLVGGSARTKPADPSRIVATTFSRRAAAEIRTRVRKELTRLAHAPESSPYVESLEALTQIRRSTLASRAHQALARLEEARFGTFHSFAHGLLVSYGAEIGIGPTPELLGDVEVREQTEEAISRALEKLIDSDARSVHGLVDTAGGIEPLVDQLRRLLTELEEDGSGARDLRVAEDARVIEKTMAALVEHAETLAPFPRFALASQSLSAAWTSQDLDSLESACAALCTIPLTGKKTPEVESFGVFRQALPGKTNEEKGRRLAQTYRFRHRFAEHAAVVREALVEAERILEEESRSRGVLGFGQILRQARQLLRDRPDIAEEVASDIDALLVDEVQDTSRVQRDLVQLLWARPEARAVGRVPSLGSVRPSGLLLVGDRKQSIYGFRGADVSVFAEMAVGLAGRPAREALGIPAGVVWEPPVPLADFSALQHNWRSPPAILSFVNEFSRRRFQTGDPPPQLFEMAYVPETEDLLSPPEATVEEGALTTWLNVPAVGRLSTRLEEAFAIANKIEAILSSGEPRTPHGAPRLRDIAILATTNNMLNAAAFALAQTQLPYVMAGKGFFDAREVCDLTALLRLVLDPGDKVAALEVLMGPWVAVHSETLLGLCEPDGGLTRPERWTSPPRPALIHRGDAAALATLSHLVVQLSQLSSRLSAGEILRESVSTMGVLQVLASLPRGDQRVANARKLMAMADAHGDARSFSRWTRRAAASEATEAEATTFSDRDDAVRLLTVHASKGLDFPIVFVPEVGGVARPRDKGLARILRGSAGHPHVLCARAPSHDGTLLEPPTFRNAYELGRRRDRAERQRLAYVSVTRASAALFLVGGVGEGVTPPRDSSLSVLHSLSSSVNPRHVVVETAHVAAKTESREGHSVSGSERAPAERASLGLSPRWKRLAIATTALADFAYCPRRFELLHRLGMPEPGNPDQTLLGWRAAALGACEYATTIAGAGAKVLREVPFVLPIADAGERSVVVRGTIDRVVVWPGGRVDVVHYKSGWREEATAPPALQLEVYALAALSLFPECTELRAGWVTLDPDAPPRWLDGFSEDAARMRVASLAPRLVEAQWTERFERVALGRCAAISCGFVHRCHPSSSGTIAKADTETMT